ncbi:MAG TPA: RNA polymerase sigma factor [Eoetvoesiella sp.]
MPLALVKTPTDSNLSDKHLAERIAQGDRAALTALMRRYNQRLYRVARSVLHNEADAEEAVQEAFFLAFRAMGKFRGDSSLATWLVRIVLNESNHRLRKNIRLSSWLEFDDALVRADEMTETTMDKFSPDRPEQALARAETRRLLEAKIDQLPPVFRTVFVMRAVEGMSVDETALCLGVPAATVRTRYFRARGMLRKLLAHEIGTSLEEAFSFAGARCDRIVASVQARLDDLQVDRV